MPRSGRSCPTFRCIGQPVHFIEFKVCTGCGFRFFGDARADGKVAPIPDLPAPDPEWGGSTLKSCSWPRQPMGGSTKKQTFALNFYT